VNRKELATIVYLGALLVGSLLLIAVGIRSCGGLEVALRIQHGTQAAPK